MTTPGPDAIPATEPSATPAAEPPVWPYVLPLAGFLALTALEGQLPKAADGGPSPVWYPVGYAIKLAAVSAILWVCRGTLRDLLPRPTAVAAAIAVVVGLAVAAVWVGIDGHYPQFKMLGSRTEFDPNRIPPAGRYAFLAVRMLGLVVLVPVIEELFYRSFLMRWIVDPVYTRVPIGKVTPLGLGATTAVFGLSHPEWLPAVLTGLAWGWLVGRTKSVSACVLSHAVANLALGVYVLKTGAWRFW